MDLGDVGFRIRIEGEEEVRRVVAATIRAQADIIDAMDAADRKAALSAKAREAAIQREIRQAEEQIKSVLRLRKSYEDLVGSMNPAIRVQNEYQRKLELVDEALKQKIITEREHSKVIQELQTQQAARYSEERVIALQKEQAALKEAEAEAARHAQTLQRMRDKYDAIVASADSAAAAEMRYAQSLREVDRAAAAGAITPDQRGTAAAILRDQYESTLAAPYLADMRAAADMNERLGQEVDRLASRMNRAERETQMYASTFRILDAALESGAISQQRYNDVMAMTRQHIYNAGHTMNQFGEVVVGNQRKFENWARGGVQQAGYQIADFAVQMQMGTSFLVAFGQQGSQLISVFGQWGAVAGAVIAVTAAVGTIFMQATKDTRTLKDAMGDLEAASSRVVETMDLVDDADLAETYGSWAEGVRTLSEAFKDLDVALQMQNLEEVLEKIRAASDPTWWQKLSAALASPRQEALGAATFAGPDIMATMNYDAMVSRMEQSNFDEMGLNIGRDVFESMIQGIKQQADSGDVQGVVNSLQSLIEQALPDADALREATQNGGLEFLANIRDAYVTTAEAVAAVTGSAREAREEAERAQEEAREAERQADEYENMVRRNAADFAQTYARYQREQRQEAERLSRETERRNEIIGESILSADRELRVLRAQVQFGRDSVAARRVQLDVELEIYREKLRQEGVDEGIVDLLVKAKKEAGLMSIALEDTRSASEKVYAILENITGLDLASNIASAANGTSVWLGRVAAVASQLNSIAANAGSGDTVVGMGGLYGWIQDRIANRQYNLERGLAMAIDLENPRVNTGYAEAADANTDRRMEELNNYWEAAGITGDGGGDGGGGGGEPENRLRDLMEEIKLERELLGVTEAQRRVYEALGEDRASYSEEDIDAAIAQVEAHMKLLEAMEQEQDIADNMKDSFAEMTMSIVKGTETVEEAFRKMALSIVEQLYDVLVVQDMIGSWNAKAGTGTGLTGLIMQGITGVIGGLGGGAPAPVVQAMGGAWLTGSQFTAYASGGVVSSPTMFGTSDGGLGLMGEAGPEGILPLHRGPSGELGVRATGAGGESVVVNNHINISGSDEATVERALRRTLPNLVEATTNAVIDARSRGGKMKTAFR